MLSVVSVDRSQMHTISIAAEEFLLNRNEKQEEENSKSFKAFLTTMKCQEFSVKYNLPQVPLFEDFVNFVIDELASPYLAPLRKAKNANYTSHTTTNELLDTTALAKEKILDSIRKSPCFKVMVIETSDVNKKKHIAVGVKYLKNGKNNVSFIQDSEIVDGKADIFSVLAPIIDKCGVITEKSGLVNDGAKAMIGQNEGIAAKLKNLKKLSLLTV